MLPDVHVNVEWADQTIPSKTLGFFFQDFRLSAVALETVPMKTTYDTTSRNSFDDVLIRYSSLEPILGYTITMYGLGVSTRQLD